MKYLIHDYAGHAFPAQLSRELARRGHEVVHAFAGELLTPRGVLARTPSDPAGLAFREVSMSPRYREWKYRFIRRRGLEVAYGRELARLVAGVWPDVVLSGNTPTEPQWTMIRRARALGVPVISWVQDFYWLAVARLSRRKFPVLGTLAGRWYRRLDARCVRASAAVVAITEDFRPILTGMGVPDAHMAVIPNWAPLDNLPVRPKRNGWAGVRALEDAFVFLYSGTLAMKHNPELLVALAERFREDATVRVVVVSEGPGADYLQRVKRERQLDGLLVLPFQPFEAMPEVLAAADVLVAVLEEDAGVFSVPSKVLTYLCANRPLLAAIPAENLAARIVAAAGAGVRVAPRDRTGFVEQAARLRSDPLARAAMGARARAYAEATFDVGAIASRFEAVAEEARGRGQFCDSRGGRAVLDASAAACSRVGAR